MAGDSGVFQLWKLRFNYSYRKYLEYALKIFWLYRRGPSHRVWGALMILARLQLANVLKTATRVKIMALLTGKPFLDT